MAEENEGGCPMRIRPPVEGGSNRDWWPDQINLKLLVKYPSENNPMDPDFDYASAVATIDVDELKADVEAVMTNSQDWWPADYGHNGPLFVRMAWHSAGTYRTGDDYRITYERRKYAAADTPGDHILAADPQYGDNCAEH